MTTPTGWLCPSCGKAHGPHIATCDAVRGDAVMRWAKRVIFEEALDRKRAERKTDLGRVVEFHVTRSLAGGRFNKTMAARYGASPKGSRRA